VLPLLDALGRGCSQAFVRGTAGRVRAFLGRPPTPTSWALDPTPPVVPGPPLPPPLPVGSVVGRRAGVGRQTLVGRESAIPVTQRGGIATTGVATTIAFAYHQLLMNEYTKASEIAEALGDPLRLALLDRLMGGPASVTELTSITGAAQSRVSNHLALLRKRGLVHARRAGRQSIYELADPTVAELVEVLLVAKDRRTPALPLSDPLAVARTCYDHLAGRLGVEVFDALLAMGAVQLGRSGHKLVRLGPQGIPVLERLGVDVDQALVMRRRFAFACLDWTERKEHLGGSLGALLCKAFLDRGWVVRGRGRALDVTDAGTAALRQYLELVLPAPGS